jgi:hypothetical protein
MLTACAALADRYLEKLAKQSLQDRTDLGPAVYGFGQEATMSAQDKASTAFFDLDQGAELFEEERSRLNPLPQIAT